MRRLGVVILGLLLAILGLARPVAAAAQFTIWPANYTYGTPSGQFTWTATTYAVAFEQSLAPFTSLRTNLAYGPTSNVTFSPSGALSGYSGGVLLADAALRVGLQTGPVGLAAYGGYGGLFFNATGPTAADRVVLQSAGTRLGVEANVAAAPGVTLRGSYTITSGLTTNANFSVSQPPPGVTGNFTGSGTGNEYEVALVLSPVPTTSVYAGYRSGTQQI
ncbi:MAG TPA: hypothetical protein VFV60_05725, partial [bacterium]|nr:hypothetical protein [bacterium]